MISRLPCTCLSSGKHWKINLSLKVNQDILCIFISVTKLRNKCAPGFKNPPKCEGELRDLFYFALLRNVSVNVIEKLEIFAQRSMNATLNHARTEASAQIK